MKQFYHYCADGQDSRNFIISRKDFIAAMNIIALCAANSGVIVVAFSLEDSHPHILIYGTAEECTEFKEMFETIYRHFAVRSRLGKGDYRLYGELYPIGDDFSYLKNVAVYTIIQPTKDGKRVMPYDYPWGTGSLYFRDRRFPPIWRFDDSGNICPVVSFGSLNKQQQREMVHSRTYTVPSDWIVCNGIILPTNYVDVTRFESIYGTHNGFRVFLSNNRRKEEEILQRMAGNSRWPSACPRKKSEGIPGERLLSESESHDGRERVLAVLSGRNIDAADADHYPTIPCKTDIYTDFSIEPRTEHVMALKITGRLIRFAQAPNFQAEKRRCAETSVISHNIGEKGNGGSQRTREVRMHVLQNMDSRTQSGIYIIIEPPPHRQIDRTMHVAY